MKREIGKCVTSAHALGKWISWTSTDTNEFQLALSYTVHLYNYLPQKEHNLFFPFKLIVWVCGE